MSPSLFSFLKSLFFYLKFFWKTLLLGILFASLASGITGFTTWAIKPVFNFIFVEKHYEYFKFIPFLLILFFSLNGLFSLLQAYFMKATSTGVVNLIRLELFKKCLNLPIANLHRQGTGQTISRVINDTAQIEPILGDVFQTLISETLTVIVLLGVAFYQKWDLTLLAFITIPVITLGTKHLGTKTRKARKLAQNATGELTHRMSELVYGIKEIKLSSSYEKVLDLFSKELGHFYRWSLKITKYREGSKSLVDIMTGIGGALVISYGGYLVIKEEMTPGAFLSVLTAILFIFNPIRKIARAYTGLREAQGAWYRITEVLSLEEEKGGRLIAWPPSQGFYFKNVSFSYDSTSSLALKNISVFLPIHKVIALVGPSGSGKTTFVSLLPRFYDPQQGEIYLDQTPLKEFEIFSLRNLFGIVLQEPFLFNLSIWENLILAKPSATKEEVIEACKQAQAHEFIENLPKKYDTVLGEEGLSLSGGQKQRIALARVFLKKPPILILDEATSQVDSLTEKAIESALEKFKGSHTIIIIAHRLSTVKKADLILVLDQGKIIAQGSHEELLKTCFLYKNLYQTFHRT
ncbi:MAG: ABC transporter ATP-binding protein/permease [Thermodesulfobacteriaceae bacterium]|nr:ABC transporter ATP-binding protein/permease [Thermodesulfobacteriaceae bacterium]MDW8136315.1 ABC transporter ATP-binding protein [Thermodesulfobacterium sp.]